MEQLIIVLMILAFSVGDIVVRWRKKRAAQDRPPGMPQPQRRHEPVEVLDEEMEEEPDWFEVLRQQQETEREPMILFPREEAPPPPPPPVLEEAPRRPVPVESTEAARGLQYGGRLAHPKPVARRVVPVRDWLRSPAEARKGIILMNVLGPCKGLD
jgi:hypothetical protein